MPLFDLDEYTDSSAPRVSGRFNPGKGKEDVEWYTPPEIIQLARDVMGGIDLDPASSAVANTVVEATEYFDEAMDGLSRPWFGRIWLNPPYGKGDKTGKWWRKLRAEYDAGRVEQALFLASSTTSTRWFHDALAHFPLLFFASRLSFWRPGAAKATQARMDSLLVYLPPLSPSRFLYESRFIGLATRLGTVAHCIPIFDVPPAETDAD